MKYALVTGGSRGIGRAVSCKLAEMGYFVLVNYQSNDAEAEKTLQLVRVPISASAWPCAAARSAARTTIRP